MGNEMPKQPKNIKFKYIFDDKYSPTYVNGGIGGVTPGQDIVLNFYFERHPIPYSETSAINDDGSIGEVVSRKPNANAELISLIRYIESGVVMNVNTAKSIRDYLTDQIKIIEGE